jgi:hypothetical protein
MESEAAIVGLSVLFGLNLDKNDPFAYGFEPQFILDGEDTVITFGCPNFEAAVRHVISKAEGPVFRSDVIGIEHLDIGYWGITDLTGIEHFTRLIELDVSGNRLTALDLSKNPNLIYLWCPDNFLTSLNVRSNARLETLVASNNMLTSLVLNAAAPYKWVDLGWNYMPNRNAITGRNLAWDVPGESGFITFFFLPQNITNVPSRPAAPTVTANGPYAVTISWALVTGATYEVYRKLQSEPDSAFKPVQTLPGGTRSWTDRTIDQNTRYSYAVLVDLFDLRSPRSPAGNMPSLAAINRAVSPVPTVTGHNATNGISALNSRVTWAAAPGTGAGAPKGYEVWRKASGEPEFSRISGSSLIAGATAAERTFIDLNVSPGVSYEYRIRTYWARWNLTGDLLEYQITDASADSNIRQFTAPLMRVPAGLRVAAIRHMEADITWTRIPGANGYELFIPGVGDFETVDDNPTALNRTGSSGNTPVRLKIEELAPNTSYLALVRAYWLDTGGNKQYSTYSAAIAFRTTGPAPRNVRAAATPGTTEIVVTWTAPTGTAPDGYIVYRDGEKAEEVVGALRFTDKNRIPGITVRYTVRAYWGTPDKFGLLSGAASATPTTPALSGVGAVQGSITPTSFTVQWNPVTGNLTADLLGYSVFAGGILAGYVEKDAPLATDGRHRLESKDFIPDSGIIINPATTYRIQVAPVWSDGDNPVTGRLSNAVSVTTPGPAPTGLAIVRVTGLPNPTNTRVNLTWNLSTNANNAYVTGFLISKMIGAIVIDEIVVSRESVEVETTANRFQWTDDNLNPGIAVRYRVQSLWDADFDDGKYIIGSGKPGSMSGILTVTPPGGAAPGGLRVRVDNPTQLTATWNAASETNAAGLISYNIRLFNLDELDGSRQPVLVRNETRPAGEPFYEMEFNNLNPSTRYRVTVTGVWEFGDGIQRTGRTATLNTRTTGPAPTGVRVAAGSLTSTSVRLTWNPMTQPGIQGYRITKTINDTWIHANERVTEIDIHAASLNITNGLVTWTDTNLRPGVRTEYTVRALWEWGIAASKGSKPGNASGRVTVNPPGTAPGSVRVRADSPTQVTVTWSGAANTAGVTLHEYMVEAINMTHPARPVTRARVPLAAGLTHTFLDLDPNTQYRFRVTSVWDAGASHSPELRYRAGRASAIVNVRTAGPAPTAFRVLNTQSTSVQLSWNPVAGAEGYRISKTVAGTPRTEIDIKAPSTLANIPVLWWDTGLIPGVQVRYSVQALWVWENGAEPGEEGSKPGRATATLRATPVRQ